LVSEIFRDAEMIIRDADRYIRLYPVFFSAEFTLRSINVYMETRTCLWHTLHRTTCFFDSSLFFSKASLHSIRNDCIVCRECQIIECDRKLLY